DHMFHYCGAACGIERFMRKSAETTAGHGGGAKKGGENTDKKLSLCSRGKEKLLGAGENTSFPGNPPRIATQPATPLWFLHALAQFQRRALSRVIEKWLEPV